MNFEKPNKIESEGSRESFEHKKLRVSNEIQQQIMGLMCSPDDGEECLTDWVEENSSKFRDVFKEVLSRDPEFLDKWENNTDNEKDRSLDFFMEELKKHDGPELKQAA